MLNTRKDFKFYHGFAQASVTLREILDEYQRLAQRLLPTLVVKVKKKICKRSALSYTYYHHKGPHSEGIFTYIIPVIIVEDLNAQ